MHSDQKVGNIPFYVGVPLPAGIPYLLATPEATPEEFPLGLILLANGILLVGAFILAYRLDRPPMEIILRLALGMVLMVLGRALYDYFFIDPQLHHMLPFKFPLVLVLTTAGPVFGTIFGWKLRPG